MMTSLQTIPRTAVRSWLSAVRLPLTAAERIAGKQGSSWPPALAFEGFEAGVKRSVGSLLHDQALVQEGTLERAKVDQLGRAAKLEAEAEERRLAAATRFEERQEDAREGEQRVERDRQARQAKLKQEEADRKRALEVAARKKEEAARKADEVRKKAVADQERQARATRLAAESQALASERQAVAARGEVLDVEKALNATKAARKRS